MNADHDTPDTLLEEAMDWLLRLNAAGDDAAQAQSFQAWLKQSQQHQIAWAKARRMWQLMGETAPIYEHVWRKDTPPVVAQPVPVRRSQSPILPRPWMRAMAAGIAVVACIGIATISYPSLSVHLRADYSTGISEIRMLVLADGSKVELAADSAIKIDMAGARRHVTLLAGEAFFDVVHDEARPFVVGAGGVNVTDLGTAFNVQLSSRETSVELAHGSAAVSMGPSQTGDVVLVPGEMVVVDHKTGRMAKSAIAQEDIAAWREGKLFVNDVTIGSVIEQLQRYHGAWITLPDTALAAQKVTGLYDLRDPDRALRALVEPYGGKVRTISPYVRLVSRF